MSDENYKPLTEEQLKQAISDLKEEIRKFPPVKKGDNERTEQLANLMINTALLLADLPPSYDESIDYFLQALDLVLSLDDKNKIAMIKGSLGSVCYAKKDYTNAAQYYKESLDLLKDSKLNNEIMIGKKGLGLSLLSMGEDENGIKILLESADLCVDLGEPDEYMDIITVLKLYYIKKEEWDMAIELEMKALKILEDIGNDREVALSHIELGLNYSRLKKYSQSLIHFKKSVNYAIKASDNKLIYQGIIMVAETYFHMRKIEKAKHEYFQALSLIAYMGDEEEIKKTSLVLLTLGASKEEVDRAISKGNNEKKNKRVKVQ